MAGHIGTNGAARILLSPPEARPSDRQALIDAIDSGWIAPAGTALTQFEADLAAYTGAPAALALASGTAALHLALAVNGVQRGDEVVVQTTTFAASAFAVVHCGGTPVFCDVDHATGTMDPAALEEFLERRAQTGKLPAAVMPVDLYGMCADYERINAICRRFGLPVIQDAAEALGSVAQGINGGNHGTTAALSFNGNKIITTSGGGAMLGTPAAVERARKLSTQAREPVPHYEHHEIGFNYRMSNLLAALGSSQLAQLEDRVARRGAINAYYRKALPDLTWMPTGVTERPNNWLSVAELPESIDPAQIVAHLDTRGIEARRSWTPMHLQPVFADNEMIGGDVAESIYARGLCLPSAQTLTEDNLERVTAAVTEALEMHRVAA